LVCKNERWCFNLAQITGTVTDGAGNAVKGMPIMVMTSSSLAQAALFYDSGFTKARGNPVFTDSNGAYGVGTGNGIFINASTYDLVYLPQALEGGDEGPAIGVPGLFADTGGSIPPTESGVIWAAGGNVTTSLASLFKFAAATTVVAGQRFLIDAQATVTNGGTAGNLLIQVGVDAGDTSVIAFGPAGTGFAAKMLYQKIYAISEVASVHMMGIMQVTTGGTLQLNMFGQSSGATGSIAANGAYIYLRRLA
jgi:hypothetical protein